MHYRYSQYYGLDFKEITEFGQHFGLNKEQIDLVKDWYNGYKVQLPYKTGESLQYVNKYNIWSVVNYLNRPEDGLVSYWEKSGSIDSIRGAFRHKEVKDKLETLANGSNINFTLKTDFSVDDFKILKEITQLGENQQLTKHGIDILFSYLFITGYLTLGDGEATYRIPNKEIRSEIGREILEHYDTIYNLDPTKLHELTNLLQKIFDKNALSPKEEITFVKEVFVGEFKVKLQEVISSFKLVKNKEFNQGIFANEDIIHSILNYIGLQTVNTHYGSEDYTEKLAGGRGRADIMIRNQDKGIIIEVKYKGDEIEALEQAKTYKALIENVEENIFIGLSVSEEKEVTIAGEVMVEGEVEAF